jgi:uncharacterized membrane protein (UPF0182 family)
VVLAVQDRLAYGPTFEAAMTALFGGGSSYISAQPSAAAAAAAAHPATAAAVNPATEDLHALIADAARDFADYQQLTAAGKLSEAGQKLEALKGKLEELQRRGR